jgi:cell division protease FtsH
MAKNDLPPNGRMPSQPPPQSPWIWFIFAVALVLPILLYDSVPTEPRGEAVSYSAFKGLVRERQIESVVLSGPEIAATRTGSGTAPARTVTTRAPAMGDGELLALLEENGVEIINEPESDGSLLVSLLPWLIFIGIWIFMINRMRALGSPLGDRFKDFLSGGASKEEKRRRRVTFADVAGQENAKREVSELVDFLKRPERFRAVGAEPPRGVLLVGPPGTGKTLLARALAGEAGVPFFSTSASEFIEMFVGVGAARVRAMFEEAKKRAPSIIFIDELDSVGRTRGAGYGGGHDEREQTLNQILAELDGFTGREAVVVLAATNRPDVLDPALLRPGRFDRHVTLSLPSRDERAAILKVHTRGVPLGGDVDLDRIAAGAPGFSGADLKNLVNEAAISAARADRKSVIAADFDEARDKIVLGTVRTLAIQPEEKHRLAVHEAGHTAVAYYTANADPLYKVTIIPRGHALGGTHLLPEEDRHTLPEDYLRARLAVMLGGRVAEKVLIGSVSSGADDDIKQVTHLARAMVGRWGMSEELGPVDMRDSEEHPFLGRELAQPRRFADQTAAKVDEAVVGLIHGAEAEARAVIEAHRIEIGRLVAELEARETLGRDEIEACLATGAGKAGAVAAAG